jgi:hypothetical protein
MKSSSVQIDADFDFYCIICAGCFLADGDQAEIPILACPERSIQSDSVIEQGIVKRETFE